MENQSMGEFGKNNSLEKAEVNTSSKWIQYSPEDALYDQLYGTAAHWEILSPDIKSGEDLKKYVESNPIKTNELALRLKQRSIEITDPVNGKEFVKKHWGRSEQDAAVMQKAIGFFRDKGKFFEKKKLYSNRDEIPASIKGSHLERPEEYRIKMRMYNSSNPEQYIRFSLGDGAGKIFMEGTLVNYYEDAGNIKKEGMLGAFPAYVISKVDETPKRSESYRNCMTVIVVGEDKETGKQISFLSHQNPSYFLTTEKDQFQKDLHSRIAELSSRAKKGTIDVGIMGGNYYDEMNNENENNKREITNAAQHKESVLELSKMVKDSFSDSGYDVPVVVMAGADYSQSPSSFNDLDIVLDTQARLLLVSRPEQFYGISEEMYDSTDAQEFIQTFDQNKDLLRKPFLETPAWKMQENSAWRAKRYLEEGGSEKDFLSFEEKSNYKFLLEKGVKVLNGFERNNAEHSDQVSCAGNLSEGEIFLWGQDIKLLKKQKIPEIVNFDHLLDSIMKDIVKISENYREIVSGQNTFTYTYNKDTHAVNYFIGGLSAGYQYIESASTQEHALIQNIASFTKDFHAFLDNYLAPENRNSYMKLFNERIKSTMKEHLSTKEYVSLFETFY